MGSPNILKLFSAGYLLSSIILLNLTLWPRIEPRVAGCEMWILPLCYAPHPPKLAIVQSEALDFQGINISAESYRVLKKRKNKLLLSKRCVLTSATSSFDRSKLEFLASASTRTESSGFFRFGSSSVPANWLGPEEHLEFDSHQYIRCNGWGKVYDCYA